MTITGEVDPQVAAAGNQSPAADPVFDVTLPKQDFDAGEPITLTTHLHTLAGADIDGGTVTIVDRDKSLRERSRAKGQAQGHGRHTLLLDTTPGEHTIIVESDAVVSGQSVHRATTHFYVVADGTVKVIGIDKVSTTAGGLVIVPVKVVSRARGHLTLAGVLAAGGTAVAQAQVGVQLDKGASTVPLTFQLADLVEPGPYRLVDVTASIGIGVADDVLAAAPGTVGQPFNVAGSGHGHAPPPLTNERGEVVGGPYGDPNTPPVDAFAPPDATPGAPRH